MKIKDVFAAVREYPNLRARAETAQKELAASKDTIKKLEDQCARLNNAGLDQRYALETAERRAAALSAALCHLCPKLRTADDLQKFYESVSQYLDRSGFTLYRTAEKLTGFDLYGTFCYEDARGMFEEADGHQLMGYLEAGCFGTVDWEIVPGTAHERAANMAVDRSTPQYQAFRKELYKSALEKLCFGDFVALAVEKEQCQTKKERGDTHER